MLLTVYAYRGSSGCTFEGSWKKMPYTYFRLSTDVHVLIIVVLSEMG